MRLFVILACLPITSWGATCTVAEALADGWPGAQWTIENQNVKTLRWVDKTQKRPTNAQIKNAVKNCDARRATKAKEIQAAKVSAFDQSKPDSERLEAMSKLLTIYMKREGI